MIRFTAYRRHIDEVGRHNAVQANPPSQPQFEGVVFSDGSVALKWLTGGSGLSYFATLSLMLQVHGHPEYGTELVWHDGYTPREWEQQLIDHAEHQKAGMEADGFTGIKLIVTRGDAGEIHTIKLEAASGGFCKQIYPPVKA